MGVCVCVCVWVCVCVCVCDVTTYNDVQQIRSNSKVTQQYERGEFISSHPYLEVSELKL